MKKTLATIITVGALVASSYAQGTVTFNNSGTTLVRQWTSLVDSTLISMPVGGGRVELLAGPAGSTDLNLFSSVAVAGFTTVAGRFSGGAQTVNGVPAGGNATLVVRGWTGSSLTWAGRDLVAGQDGWSSIWTQATGGVGTPPSTPVSILPGFTGLTLAPVPEPSSMVLAGLGAASLLLFRRRK